MEPSTLELLKAFLIIGMFFAVASISCAKITFKDPKDRNLFGVPFGVIGLGGYVLMLILISSNLIAFYILMLFTILTTPWFIAKSIRLKKFCIYCGTCWLINVILAVISADSLL